MSPPLPWPIPHLNLLVTTPRTLRLQKRDHRRPVTSTLGAWRVSGDRVRWRAGLGVVRCVRWGQEPIETDNLKHFQMEIFDRLVLCLPATSPRSEARSTEHIAIDENEPPGHPLLLRASENGGPERESDDDDEGDEGLDAAASRDPRTETSAPARSPASWSRGEDKGCPRASFPRHAGG